MKKNIVCQVCGNYTISEYGSFDICPVCYWEDDGFCEDPDEVRGGPNKDLSLAQARRNFKEFGAIDREALRHIREPKKIELPEYN